MGQDSPWSFARLPDGCRIGIVGLGLMGGSLAAALRTRRPDLRLLGVARRPETLALAVEKGLVDGGSVSLAEAVPEVDVLVLAVPVRSIVGLVPEAATLLRDGALLTDLGSTKSAVVAAMTASPAAGHCVGGHPMCGRELHGLEAAQADLYVGATWALCPTATSDEPSLMLAAGLARAAGAVPMLIEPDRHDAIVARTSHLPYAVAASLVRAVAAVVPDGELQALSAGGYRDTTRLAASDCDMMLDILLTNRQHVLSALADMAGQIGELVRMLERADEVELRRFLEQARHERRLK
jgi:prephenate dehydrogenase